MRKLIVVYGGVNQSAVLNNILTVSGVNDALSLDVIDAAIVDTEQGKEQQVKSQLQSLSGVATVFEEIQAVPMIADASERDSLLADLAETRGYEIPLPEDAPQYDTSSVSGSPTAELGSIDDSLGQIGVPELHDSGATGSGVIVANVDTGVFGSQFNSSRLMEGLDTTGQGDPYQPVGGHGSYTMGVAAGDSETEGITRGPAYEADIFPVKVSFGSGGLLAAADGLQKLAQNTDGSVVVNHSWGYTNCTGVCNRPETEAFVTAMTEPNAYHVWSAGNGARRCGGRCSGDRSNGINGPNSTDAAITVAATGRDGDPAGLQSYSSRGPGSCGSAKPDVAAPIYGVVPYGGGSRNIGNRGGTSGAAPQVAGVIAAALSTSRAPELSTIQERITQTATETDDSDQPRDNCVGHGNIDASDFFSLFSGGVSTGITADDIAYGSALASLGITSIESGLYEP